MTSAALGPEHRADALRTAQETEFDVLIVGGGVTGAGAALDAASRGLSVALVEARDFASGTSSRSSKLIHGGLRYLEQRDFTLVREALKERSLLLNHLAPHLVRPVKFLIPLRHRVWERGYIGAGVLLYDTIGGAGAVPRHRHVSRRAALRAGPSLRSDALVGGIQYYDAQVDDARYTTTLARTAAEQGATVLTRAEVTGLLREGRSVTGAWVADHETGREFRVRARKVISATGVWTDDLVAEAGAEPPFTVHASKGIHITVPRERIELDTGLLMRTEKSVLFVIPWQDHWIIGTTDTPWELDRAHPAASSADVDYVLGHVNAMLRNPLTREDIDGVYAGLRPLLAGQSAETAKLSREHAIAEPVPGLLAIAGGKYTTYRVMAKDVVDTAVQGLDRAVGESRTEQLRLFGASGFAELWDDRRELAAGAGLAVETVEHLLRRYGSGIHDLLELIAERPALGEAIPGAQEYLGAEAHYAVTHEGALHLEDVLTRRTRISIEGHDRGLSAAPRVARIMAPLLGWTDEQLEREVRHYTERVQAERAAQNAADDTAANGARLTAPDVAALAD
ncbi:glycerol-3-phosphate dehydrogenase [Salinifilum aidingensis]